MEKINTTEVSKPIDLLTPQDKIRYGQIMSAIENGKNIFFHGPGGTGKSYTIRKIVAQLNEEKAARKVNLEYSEAGKIFVTATTGIAAVNLGTEEMPVTTLHSFAGAGTGAGEVAFLVNRIRTRNPTALQRWKKCKILVIDEVSMLGGTFFTKLSAIAQTIRENQKPFGGIQLILSGDFMQLSPVKDTWIYTTKEWREVDVCPFPFVTPYRYSDPSFFDMLLRIRNGRPNERDIKILSIRTRSYMELNKKLKELEAKGTEGVIKPTIFYSKRVDVKEINNSELSKLKSRPLTFIARDNISYGTSASDAEQLTKLLDENCPPRIELKQGAQVMLKTNLDPSIGLANGSRGVITKLISTEQVEVKFISGLIKIIGRYEVTAWTKKTKATRVQIPLVLAYSMTIHKSQGSTLDFAVINLGKDIFTDGQAYVALSRCKTLKGMFINEFDPASIFASKGSLIYSGIIDLCSKLQLSIKKYDLAVGIHKQIKIGTTETLNRFTKTVSSFAVVNDDILFCIIKFIFKVLKNDMIEEESPEYSDD